MNIMRFRPLFLFLSGSLLFLSFLSMIVWRFQLSTDFTGGTVWEISSSHRLDESKITDILKSEKISLVSLHQSDNQLSLRLSPVDESQKLKITADLRQLDDKLVERKFETTGPILGRELITKTIVAVVLSSLALLWFIGSKFKDFSFGLSAIIAMLHDTIILLGAFSILGHFYRAEIDSLFVTALLTTLSASVHDTVVTFDRIRELRYQNFKSDWVELANRAVAEVIVRSINNSLTIIFMLLALVVLGGLTTRWFSLALLIGVVSGTYSSIGVAIPLVLFFKKKQN